ncbi:MAG TPA: hypothetical protein VF832_15380, partial [Longimicrobiales bacterium]
MRYRACLALILPAALALAAAPVLGQDAASPVLSGANGALGAAFERYGFGDARQTGLESISLVTVPFGARMRLLGVSTLDLSGAYARGGLTRQDGSTATLSGLTDTQLALTVPVKGDLATLSAVALLPTGKSSM